MTTFAWLLFLWLGVVAGLPAAAQEKRSIRIATEGASPPFNYLDENNELQGFEIDLAKALCEVMKAQCSFVVHDWDGIIRGLLNREYDAIVDSLQITDRRQKRIAFSRRYYLMPAAFIARKDSDVRDVTPQALAGMTVGAPDHSEHAAYLQDLYSNTQLRTYGKLEDANLDLLTGRIDLVLGDKLALSHFLNSREGTCCRFVADAPANALYHGRGVGVGLRKEDEDLRNLFDLAIGKVMADGTYDRIRAKYFPFDIR